MSIDRIKIIFIREFNSEPVQPYITVPLRRGPMPGDNLAKLLADTKTAIARFESEPNVYKSPEDNPLYGT